MPPKLVGLDRNQPFLQNSYTLALLAHAAYAPDAASHASFKKTTFTDCVRFFSPKTGADGFVTADDKNVVVAFRGTEEPLDALTNASLAFTDTEFGRIHRGFWTAVDSVWDSVVRHVEKRRNKAQTLWVTGHSLGAAMATIAAARLETKNRPDRIFAATFGQPRTGGGSFATAFRSKLIRLFRFVHNDDIVTTIPPRVLPLGVPPEFYEHVGDLQFLDVNGKLIDKPDQEVGVFTSLLSAVNAVSGNDADARRIALRGVQDHSMEHYVRRLAENQP